MRVIATLGGNALLQRGQKPDADVQEHNVRAAVGALAPLAEEHELVLTHGNGPQVGVLALQSASDPRLTTPYPFDVLGAQTQGMIGYWLLQAMQNELPNRQVAAIINQTLVEAADPAFADPTKFVGEMYTEEEAKRLASERGWAVKPDGTGWRRVVGSPRPHRVVETRLIRMLLQSGAIVVCAGGGGVPVIRNERGELDGVEAVVDKDLTSSVLAEALDADVLMILTDVPNVMKAFGTPEQEPVLRATPASLRALDFAAGSMGPKVEAVCRFVELTGGIAAIGRLEDGPAILRGEAGTIITPDGTYDGLPSQPPKDPDRLRLAVS
ncbi:carbamate kinase [Nocardioides marmotae]|uniref:Carbamate kinase n=1 Tax=Nocardioides marmotae TaxID=2663857 RepID=A0A6I3J958_9ACTN|nr:carbamate kinase [Nocardioides marmotae]MCR6030067.1 carbamate kinase [Gordonia jinghuaiqii]MBC9733024.1 carbamate kinase [Nocardioides marmotae]MTB84138.1 carbamate kinase [Nocardioides marmotae]MTB93698.1 carbamate kinase [Nocardioides marmotae]QKE00044.1 carbamate kinase [Nocardioides marmotae]